MNARSALFDVYGDHLRQRGGEAPVAGLVRLLAPLGIASPAVRTAISRMAAQGWLAPTRLEQGAGYRLTGQAERRLTAAAGRIYRTTSHQWDGRWHLVVVDRIPGRAQRDRVRNAMSYLGYGHLRDSTWISPRASDEMGALLEAEGVQTLRFWATHDGDQTALASDAWNLDDIDKRYARWLEEARAMIGQVDLRPSDEDAFVLRSALVHEWRKFLFSDPELPRELLPDQWAGDEAAAFFDEQAARLLPGAGRFVDLCLQRP